MGCCGSKTEKLAEGDEVIRKILVVGDKGAGKTCLIARYTKDEFDEDAPQEYIPSSLQVEEKEEILGKDKKVKLHICDTGGQETFRHLKKMKYLKADAALICFGIENKECFGNVKKLWIDEMKKVCPGVPLLLVGNKRDLKAGAGSAGEFVTEKQGHSLAKKNKLMGYMECSSLTGEGVENIFKTIAREAEKKKLVRTEEENRV